MAPNKASATYISTSTALAVPWIHDDDNHHPAVEKMKSTSYHKRHDALHLCRSLQQSQQQECHPRGSPREHSPILPWTRPRRAAPKLAAHPTHSITTMLPLAMHGQKLMHQSPSSQPQWIPPQLSTQNDQSNTSGTAGIQAKRWSPPIKFCQPKRRLALLLPSSRRSSFSDQQLQLLWPKHLHGWSTRNPTLLSATCISWTTHSFAPSQHQNKQMSARGLTDYSPITRGLIEIWQWQTPYFRTTQDSWLLVAIAC